ncbi:Retrovirus-related Pol polyprotein from transposon RE1 [Bienertia sinuspersici]
MVFDETLLKTKRSLQIPISIKLPDGSICFVHEIGVIELLPNLMIQNVLLVKNFKSNLLSVSKLVEHNGVKVIFNEHGCLFQDLVTNKTIGFGQKIGGLFILKNNQGTGLRDLYVNSTSQFTASTHTALANTSSLPRNSESVSCNNKHSSVNLHKLHARLGHPSLSRMQHITICNCSGVKELSYDICVGAKQHKLPFVRSQDNASQCFELIHVDL